MLTSPTDYKYQPTGDYDVSRIPVYALPPPITDRPLYYSDMLYLSEAFLCAMLSSNQGISADWYLPTADNLPLNSQNGKLYDLLSRIRSEYNESTPSYYNSHNNFVNTFYAADASFGEFITYTNDEYALKDNALFRAAFLLPDLTSETDFSPFPSLGNPIEVEKFLRAWNALAKMKRVFLRESFDLAGTETTKYYTDGEYQSKYDYNIASQSAAIYYAGNGAYRRHGGYEDYTDSVCTVTIPSKQSFISFNVNGVGMCVSASYRGSSIAQRYWFLKQVTGGNPFTLATSSQEALSYASKFGIDTSNDCYIRVRPEFVDLTFTFRHDINT